MAQLQQKGVVIMDTHTFPSRPEQIPITFLSDDAVPLNIEGTLSDQRSDWGAVVCHPHPLHGGTMQNKVVDTAYRTVFSEGGNALRFNYRGVGTSEGSYGEGISEVGDLRGAMTHLQDTTVTKSPVWLIGFSFGTRVISYHMAKGGEADGVILIAPPLGSMGLELFPSPRLGVHMILGEKDEFCRPEQMQDFHEKLSHPEVTSHVIPDAGHFFHGYLQELVSWLRGRLALGQS